MSFPLTEMPTIMTARFVLRPIERRDAGDMTMLYADEEVVRYTPLEPYVTIEDGVKAVEWCTNIFAEGTGIRWGIEDPSSGTVIGTCGYLNYEPEHRRIELGYDLAKRYWGQGIMTEVAEAVIDFGFRHLGINRIEAKIIPDNEASGHLLIKLGFQYEGKLRQHEFEKGRFIDIAVYSILREERQGRINSSK
ncbi:N-acetyltransferase [Shouchella clausii]|jgi:[ribosomal protein S5]-alanine N-acetyltransferase|uniref:GNAT family N-acetyltransferase n=1 Tax=Shouchella clausii TaxID=79880 RepID=UPI000BA778FC|nr:GNAT family protein [Shouchella clausii]PAD41446.1 N-acetyltransferase [Bacillus sp. 7520-S]MBU8597630.1 GNAT family N-acetyltransferase [Shouchella clausii]MCY1105279.1 GNAT family protein [Shouchella clausii]MED4159543.1 GNAT family protein [Shouchella clausii]MED4177666.1 GNAT family protein [Shouchella clausii]